MRDLAVPLKLALTLWLAAASAIHLYFGGFGFPEPITMRGFHLLVFVPPLFLLYPLARPRRCDAPACRTGPGPPPPRRRMPG